MSRCKSLPIMLGVLVATVLLATPVRAMKDETNQGRWEKPVENGPDKDVPGFLVNLGPTGARAVLTDKTFMVRYIFPGSPAGNKLKLKDVITGAFGKPFTLFGVQWGWGVGIVALLFGFMHVLNLGSLVERHWVLTPWWGVWNFFAGLAFSFVRERTGSIVAPALLHGLPQGIAWAILGL